MSKNGKILVAMSGGIDSSIAAMMLHEEGYEVIGMTMKTWDYASSGGSKKETGCCSLDSINDARNLAVKFGFPHYIIDLREEFGTYIIDDFVNEYMAGRTPNPCVLCNTHIKWEALLKRADTLLIGGAMAYTFLKAQGNPIGDSLLDAEHIDLAKTLLADAPRMGKSILMPIDHRVASEISPHASAEVCGRDIPDGKIGLDIGPKTALSYAQSIKRAKLIVWNGPMGMFELPAFEEGTMTVAEAMAESGGTTIIGGGDSVAAVNKAGLADRISHISTGGGASLKFLEGQKLPGIEALTDA